MQLVGSEYIVPRQGDGWDGKYNCRPMKSRDEITGYMLGGNGCLFASIGLGRLAEGWYELGARD
jgi:hypothetical protein